MTPTVLADTHAAAFTQARPWSADEFADLLNQKFCHVSGNSACFALIRVIADEAELLTIATHPDNQRQGHAKACMADWQAKAVTLGATRAFLEVAADNHPALALYLACGFTEIGIRPGYYRRTGAATCDAVLMSRRLPPV